MAVDGFKMKMKDLGFFFWKQDFIRPGLFEWGWSIKSSTGQFEAQQDKEEFCFWRFRSCHHDQLWTVVTTTVTVYWWFAVLVFYDFEVKLLWRCSCEVNDDAEHRKLFCLPRSLDPGGFRLQLQLGRGQAEGPRPVLQLRGHLSGRWIQKRGWLLYLKKHTLGFTLHRSSLNVYFNCLCHL